MIFRTQQVSIVIRELIRNFGPRAGRVVMVFAEKEAIQSQRRQNVGQSCSIDGWIW